jgi:hypothetical protein
MDFDLASLAMNSDPVSQQKLLAQIMRGRKREDESAALAQAGQRTRQFDELAAVAPMMNNKGALGAAISAQKSAQGFAPTQLGNTGFMLPETGQFVESPMYADEKDAQRESTAANLAERLRAMREVNDNNVTQRREAAQQRYDLLRQGQESTNAFRTTMAEIARLRAEAALANVGSRQEKDAEKKADAEEKAVAAEVQKLSAFSDKKQLPRLIPQARKLLGVIGKYGDKDVPGLSMTDQMAMRVPFGKAAMSKDAIENAATYQGILNALTRADAGLSQTQGEVLRQALETFNSPTASSRDRVVVFRDHVAPLLETIRSATVGSAPERARSAYRKNQEQIAGDPSWMDPLNLQAAPSAPPKGVDANTWKHMTPEERALFK